MLGGVRNDKSKTRPPRHSGCSLVDYSLACAVIWIIGGPTSVGKSTFIASTRCREITNVAADAAIIIPGQDDKVPAGEKADCFYHYNILRPASLLLRRNNEPDIRATHFENDPKWLELVATRRAMKAVVLVADRDTIIQRVRQRTIREKESPSPAGRPYNPEHWLTILDKIDMNEVYKSWCAELDRRGIPRLLVDSSNQQYVILETLP
jgi:hypothetical protein